MSFVTRPQAMNDWNTTFPTNLGQVTEVADALGAQGFDVHTVKIELDNGFWSVDFLSTDTDMADHCTEFQMDSSGNLEKV